MSLIKTRNKDLTTTKTQRNYLKKVRDMNLLIFVEENKDINYAAKVMQKEQEITIRHYEENLPKSWIDKTIYSVYHEHFPIYDTETSKL